MEASSQAYVAQHATPPGAPSFPRSLRKEWEALAFTGQLGSELNGPRPAPGGRQFVSLPRLVLHLFIRLSLFVVNRLVH